jgi:excisionase family DNA binding protein
LLTVEEVAEWLKVSPQTVRVWRYRGKGPRVIKVGHHPRYRRADVESWLLGQTTDPAERRVS